MATWLEGQFFQGLPPVKETNKTSWLISSCLLVWLFGWLVVWLVGCLVVWLFKETC